MTISRSEEAAGLVRLLHAELAALQGEALPVELWDGSRLGPADAPFRLVLTTPWAARAALLPPGDLAAGSAFVRGDLEVRGDLFAALGSLVGLGGIPLGLVDRARLLALLVRLPAPPRRGGGRRHRRHGRTHTPARDRAAIAFHYDLAAAFYAGFLDDDLVYSCAYFGSADDTLETAQRRKLDMVARKLGLQPGQRVLDIGCGWGSFLLHAASTYGVEGVGVTLSSTQARIARERVAAAGLEDRIDIRLQDYRELDERFDAVASIGMVEHVGPRHLPEYMAKIHELLVDGGRVLNHGITTGTRAHVERSGRERDFVGTHVFPDGGLVPAWRMIRELQIAGFALADVQQLRPHYARTLREWVARLEDHWEQAVGASSLQDSRVWRLYMAGSALAFERGDLGVVQILGTRGLPALPPGRTWMEPHLGGREQVPVRG